MIDQEYYRKLYDDCYYDRMNDMDYNCVKKYLHKIVKHYYLKIKGVYFEPEINSFKPILDCFDKLIKENNYNNLEENIDFMFTINKFSVNFAPQLYTLMSPHKVYEESNSNYFNIINDFFWIYETTYRDRICRIKSNSRMQEILNCYMKYSRSIPDTFGMREINNVSSRIGAIFYLTDKDINELDKIYTYLFDNFETIKNSFALNANEERNYFIEMANFVMTYKIDKPKKLIK